MANWGPMQLEVPEQAVATGSQPKRRDYSLIGPEAAAAIAAGLANAEWYRPPVDPDRLKQLMERNNWRPARDTALWVALLAGTGVAAFISLGTWYAIPAFAAFGALYGGSGDPRWHENGHGTAFRAKWANDVVYNVASFMILREPTLWRWSHFRHHSDTIIVGRDAEISFQRPPKLWMLIPAYLNLIKGPSMVWHIFQHAFGRIDGTTRELVPKQDLKRVVWEARAYVAVLGAVTALAIASGSIVPLLFVGLPSFYGAWLLVFFGITQHAGLREDVLDHRLNTRTVYLNPFFRFLYLNMNYHLEHHLFPSVPYYNLPQLHEEIKQYLPPPKTSIFAAYREVFHALRRQQRDPAWELPTPDLPGGPFVPRARVPEVAGPGPVDNGAAGASFAEAPAAAVESAPAGGAGHGGAAAGGAAAERADLGPVEALGVGQVRRVDVAGRTYALYRLAADEFALTDGLCTHAQSHLADGHLEGSVIECPKHNGRFDVRTGEAVRRPPQRPLCTYPVDIIEGRVVADLAPAVLPAQCSSLSPFVSGP